MRPFRGNCQQVAIMECQLIASGMAMKVDSSSDPPLFTSQKDYKPKVTVEKFAVRTDAKQNGEGKKIVGKHFLPQIYFCKFVYNLTTDKAEVHMDRQVIDLLLKLLPEPLKTQLMQGME